MATFSFQNFPFPTDSIFLPNTQVKMPFPVEENNNTNCFSQISPIEPTQQIPVDVGIHESSYLDYGSKVAATDNEPSLSQKQSPESSTVVELDGGEQVTQKVAPMAKRRKYRNWASASYAQSKDRTEGKKKKQRKCSGSPERVAKKPKAEKKVLKEPPTGYIHVRARRGQATDSHSLAERVRREKISQRLKILQRLVPGCERITGKAPMLDEIINYVQSMQNQVEFLSMKLASVSPIFYDFGVDLDELVTWPEGLTSMASALPSVAQCSPTQPTLFADTASTAAFTSPDNYHFVRDSPSVLLQNEPRPSAVSQDIDSVFCDAEDQGQKFLSPSGFSNLCFFH